MAANIQKNNNKKSIVEVVKDIRNGAEVEILKIDGVPCGIMGYINEKDKEAGIKTIQDIVDNSDKNGLELAMEVAYTMQMAAMQNEAGIEANDDLEPVVIQDEQFFISYKNRVIYTNNFTEVANLADMPNMPAPAIKAMLVDRATIWINK